MFRKTLIIQNNGKEGPFVDSGVIYRRETEEVLLMLGSDEDFDLEELMDHWTN